MLVSITGECGVATTTCTSNVKTNCLMGNLDFAPASVLGQYDANNGKGCIDALTAAFNMNQVPGSTYVSVQKTCADVFSGATAARALRARNHRLHGLRRSHVLVQHRPDRPANARKTSVAVNNGLDCSAPGSTWSFGVFL